MDREHYERAYAQHRETRRDVSTQTPEHQLGLRVLEILRSRCSDPQDTRDDIELAARSLGLLPAAGVAFDIMERGYRVVGTYVANPNASWAIVEVFKDDKLVRELRCEAYRIYNYAAHASDLIDVLEAAVPPAPSAAPSAKLGPDDLARHMRATDADFAAAPSDAEVEALIVKFERAVRNAVICGEQEDTRRSTIAKEEARVDAARAALRSLLAARPRPSALEALGEKALEIIEWGTLMDLRGHARALGLLRGEPNQSEEETK